MNSQSTTSHGDLVIDTGSIDPQQQQPGGYTNSTQSEPRNLTLNSPELNSHGGGSHTNHGGHSHNHGSHSNHLDSHNNTTTEHHNRTTNHSTAGIDLTPSQQQQHSLSTGPQQQHNPTPLQLLQQQHQGNPGVPPGQPSNHDVHKNDVIQAGSPSSLSSSSLERPYPGLTRSTSLVEPTDFLFHRDSRFLFQPGPHHGFLRQHSHPIVEFPTKSGMQRHARDVHMLQEKAHKCEKCFKSFPSSQQLQQHMLVHTNIRKYKCQYCDKAFKQLSHVQQHHRRHTGERPYKCMIDECGKAFAQLSNLQQHQRNHENRKNQAERKPYLCTVCDRRFSTENSLNNHVTKGHVSRLPNSFENGGDSSNDGSFHHIGGLENGGPMPPPLLQFPPPDGSEPMQQQQPPAPSRDGMNASNDLDVIGPPHSNENGILAIPTPHYSTNGSVGPVANGEPLTNHMQDNNSILKGASNQRPEDENKDPANGERDNKTNRGASGEMGSDMSQEFPGLGPAANDIINAATMAVARRMNELSKRDLNLLRFSRAGLYDFPSQVPPMHSSMLVAQPKQ